jgi:hypothetical protein
VKPIAAADPIVAIGVRLVATTVLALAGGGALGSADIAPRPAATDAAPRHDASELPRAGGAAATVPTAAVAAPADVIRSPERRPCPSAPAVRIDATDPRDTDTVCDGAAAALRFFEARGLRTLERIDIDVRPALPPEVGPRATGCWLPSSGRVVILDRAAFQRRRTWLGVPIQPGLQRAIAAHEVAHALAGCNFVAPRPPIHAQEYVAYVVTLVTMPAALRDRVLKATPGDGFATVSTIGELLYAFDTQRFGIESYRHYTKPDHGDAFLRRVLAGEALAE